MRFRRRRKKRDPFGFTIPDENDEVFQRYWEESKRSMIQNSIDNIELTHHIKMGSCDNELQVDRSDLNNVVAECSCGFKGEISFIDDDFGHREVKIKTHIPEDEYRDIIWSQIDENGNLVKMRGNVPISIQTWETQKSECDNSGQG